MSTEPKQVDEWIGSEQWRLAIFLHGLFCRQGHQMDQCWGLNDTYSLNKPTMDREFRHWVGAAAALMNGFDAQQIDTILTILNPNYEPDPFPVGPNRVAA